MPSHLHTIKLKSKKDGTSGCTKVGEGPATVKFTVGGWAAPGDDKDSTDTGAKTLAAAFTAGALAVAATQF